MVRRSINIYPFLAFIAQVSSVRSECVKRTSVESELRLALIRLPTFIMTFLERELRETNEKQIIAV